jgi:hypothetical protein
MFSQNRHQFRSEQSKMKGDAVQVSYRTVSSFMYGCQTTVARSNPLSSHKPMRHCNP